MAILGELSNATTQTVVATTPSMVSTPQSVVATTPSVGSIGDALMQMLYSVIAYLPGLIAAIVILVIGWVIGRLLGKVISGILDKIGVDDALLKTSVGQAIEQSGTHVVTLFDLIVRWFIYLIAIVAAANILQLEFLTSLLQSIVVYLPHVALFLIILIVGFIMVDFFSDVLEGWGKTQDIEFLGLMIMLLRVFFYFIVLVLALSQSAHRPHHHLHLRNPDCMGSGARTRRRYRHLHRVRPERSGSPDHGRYAEKDVKVNFLSFF